MIRARFFVAGDPAPQGSKRIVQPKGHRRPLLLEMSKKLPAWRAAVAAEAMLARQRYGTLTGPLALLATFTFTRPKRPAHAYPTVDLDKILRSTNDALVHGGLVADDRQVVSIVASKAWCVDDTKAGCAITVSDA